MGSDSSAAIEALAAVSETAQPVPHDNTQKAAYEEGEIVEDELKASDVAEFDGFLNGESKLKAGQEDSHELQAAPVDRANGDAGSGWLSATPQEANGSGWISADGAPVTLPPFVSPQPWSTSRRTVYLIRIPRSVDEKLRNEIKLAEAKVEQTIKKRDVHKAALQAKKNSKIELLEKLRPIRDKERSCRDALQGKRMELEPFSVALNKFRSAQSRGQDICSSEEELNEKIAEIHFRIQHESIPLKEEKQLLRYVKQLEATRHQVCANSVMQAELMENLGPKEDIQDQAKFLRQDLDSIRKEHRLARAEYDSMDREINKLNEAIEELRQQYEKANVAQQDAYVVLRELKRQENLMNDPFYQNRRDVQVVRELASQKKVKEVDDICTKQVEDFFVMWNNDSKFRADYVKSNERSTVRRLETLDGRALGPNEKPPVVVDSDALLPTSRDTKSALVAETMATGPIRVAKLSSGVVGPELSNGVLVKETKPGKNLPVHVKDEEAGDTGYTKSRQIDVSEDSADLESQAAERKEKLRQEQIAKAKEAEERKKKRSAQLESRALARARKEADRKEKEREKKAQKKVAAGGLSSGADQTTLNEESDLSEAKLEEAITESAVPEEGSKTAANSSNKDRKGAVSRRKLPGKEIKQSKVLLSKRSSKKAAWPIPIWAIASLAALVLLVAFILFMKL
eukprot:c12036_g1_i1 orf=279-2333(-)